MLHEEKDLVCLIHCCLSSARTVHGTWFMLNRYFSINKNHDTVTVFVFLISMAGSKIINEYCW